VDTDLTWRVPDIKPGLTEVSPPRYPGSGFVVDDSGHVVTCAGFLAGWRMVWVRTGDGEERPAEVVGVDEPTGIALLKIADPPPPVAWAPPDDPEADAALHLIGLSPELGVVDVPALATGRRVRSGFTQIERSYLLAAAAEPVCWGGPAVDGDGRVAGLTVARPGPFSDSGRALVVPTELLLGVIERLESSRGVERPYLGLVPDAGEDGAGLLVRYVIPGSPAEAAGLAEGDLLETLDGGPVGDPIALQAAVLARGTGEAVELGILRGGGGLTVRVVLGERPAEPRLGASDALHFYLGLQTEPVPGGFRVTGLVPDGAADRLAWPLEMPKVYRALAGACFDTERDEELETPGVLERVVAESYLERDFAVGLFWGPTRYEGKVFIVPLTLPLIV
jgi:serine protease DegQ